MLNNNARIVKKRTLNQGEQIVPLTKMSWVTNLGVCCTPWQLSSQRNLPKLKSAT